MYHLTVFALFRVIHIQVSALIPCQYVVLVTSYLHTCSASAREGKWMVIGHKYIEMEYKNPAEY